MTQLFLSYSREDRPVVEALAADLRASGYTPYFDEELVGGQDWWSELLSRIEDARAFVPVLTPGFLDSTPCQLEAAYAAALGKPFLPVSVEPVPPQLCPEAISSSQWVDYDHARTAFHPRGDPCDQRPRPDAAVAGPTTGPAGRAHLLHERAPERDREPRGDRTVSAGPDHRGPEGAVGDPGQAGRHPAAASHPRSCGHRLPGRSRHRRDVGQAGVDARTSCDQCSPCRDGDRAGSCTRRSPDRGTPARTRGSARGRARRRARGRTRALRGSTNPRTNPWLRRSRNLWLRRSRIP